MAGQLRVYRRRIRSVQSTKKITRAMELIAASRIAKAQQRVAAARPYADAITGVVSAVASQTSVTSPLTTPRENPVRAAVLVITSDRGLAGAYNANALRTAEELRSLVHEEGKEPVPYLVGRKAVAYYRFRGRDLSNAWTGFSEQPAYENAKEVAGAVIDAFVRGADDGGVDEIHLVHTEFVSALTQRAVARRILPLVITYTDEPEHTGPTALYEFEPSAEAVLENLLPRYIEARIYSALLESAASESAARRRAMKAASDNADDLIKTLTRAANAARQAEITQEIMEIVGGAEALSKTGGD
ncbi:MAG: F0F1 ATP synthase subunit gamma [Mycobacteriales bacterium]|jgi:F-type H+-transporting ATPase subunit gamma